MNILKVTYVTKKDGCGKWWGLCEYLKLRTNCKYHYNLKEIYHNHGVHMILGLCICVEKKIVFGVLYIVWCIIKVIIFVNKKYDNSLISCVTLLWDWNLFGVTTKVIASYCVLAYAVNNFKGSLKKKINSCIFCFLKNDSLSST